MLQPGKKTVETIEVPADERRLHEVRDFVSRTCSELGFTGRALANIRLAVDEACTNVVKHAYASGAGTLQVQVGTRRGGVEIRILDQGQPFDGRVEIPHLGQWIDARRKGGLGVFLMHRLMDEVRYETSPAGNEWILRKRLPRPTSELARRLRRTWVGRAALVIATGSLAVAVPLAIHEGQARSRAELGSLVAHARGLAEAARPALVARAELSPEQTHLFEAVAALGRAEPRLLAITVVDREHTIWASDRSAATFTRYFEPTGLGAPDLAGVRQVCERIDGEPVLHMSMPVLLAPSDHDPLGTVHLSMRWQRTEAAIRGTWWRILLATLGLDILAVALVVTFVMRFLDPLQRLVDGVRALGTGGADGAEDDPDEIGAIAATLDSFQTRYRAAQESAAEHAKLQEEMVLAREIQASILPSSVPEVPGYAIARLYRPAQEVGGDYYDFLDAGPGLTGVVVADVAGKGVPGSLIMSMVRTALRMETRRNTHAGDVLSRLHAFVSPDLRKGMFVTMLYVVLDARNRVASYASAGHTPLLLYRARTGEVQSLAPRGIPVGLAGSDANTFESNLDVERLRLQAGDMLLLYTDGITEARDAEGREYGEARLLEMLRRHAPEGADAVVRRLEADVVAFTGEPGPQDDLTLVAIEEKGEVSQAAGEVQRKILDLVDVQGVPIVDACKQLKVSPSTYYRLKRTSAETLPLDPSPPAAALSSSRAAPEANDLRAAQGGLRGVVEPPVDPDQIVIVRLEGSLDSGACGAFERLLGSAQQLGARIVVDLAAVAYISSRGWGLLAATRAALQPYGELALCGMRPETRDVYRMLGFEALLRSFADRDAARAAFASILPAAAVRAAPVTSPAAPAAAPVGAAIVQGADLDADWESLRVRVGRIDGGVTIVALTGILDTVSALKLGRIFESLVREGSRRILVDVSGLEFVSSAGWGCFTAPVGELRAAGGDLRLFGMAPAVARIFNLLHLGAVLQSFDVLAEARQSFGPVATSIESKKPVVVARVRANVFEHGGLRAELKLVARSRRVQRLRLEGELAAPAAAELVTWLTARVTAPTLLVDAAHLSRVAPGGWTALAIFAADVAPQGIDVAVVGVDPGYAPAVELALPVFATEADALRTDGSDPGLGSMRFPDTELHRDAELRAIGWQAYIDLLRDSQTEESAA